MLCCSRSSSVDVVSNAPTTDDDNTSAALKTRNSGSDNANHHSSRASHYMSNNDRGEANEPRVEVKHNGWMESPPQPQRRVGGQPSSSDGDDDDRHGTTRVVEMRKTSNKPQHTLGLDDGVSRSPTAASKLTLAMDSSKTRDGRSTKSHRRRIF